MSPVISLDIRLSGLKNAIAAYFIPYSGGVVLIDPGPGSTLETLKSSLADYHLEPENVTHVLLTHIHLDHAGATGWLAGKGAQIHVHPVGAPHMLNPEKLLASARRIYGDQLEKTWGDFLPVPVTNLKEVRDGEEIVIGELHISALYTPGHAEHHIAYVYQNTCFCGDVGGVRKPGRRYVRLPFVPPETHLGKWHSSLKRIMTIGCRSIALTHFGIYDDAPAHLDLASHCLDEIENWLELVMPEIPDVETLQERYITWLHERGRLLGLDEETLTSYDYASPAQMGASGLFRYWHKVRMGE
jgi:glyoxylase-like metal-dependent hydrolase (beta-lactamase superfamily II)